jgi:hypothetical protein
MKKRVSGAKLPVHCSMTSNGDSPASVVDAEGGGVRYSSPLGFKYGHEPATKCGLVSC